VTTSNRIITELLDFTRRHEPERVETSVNAVVRDYLDRVGAPDGVELIVNLADDLPDIQADPHHLGMVLGNLVRNAGQAMPAGGRLRIETARDAQGDIRLSVSDSGVGIPPEHRERIFEPLFSTRTTGSGLGLAVVKRLTEANGDAVEVASEPGQGSRFTVRFAR